MSFIRAKYLLIHYNSIPNFMILPFKYMKNTRTKVNKKIG